MKTILLKIKGRKAKRLGRGYGSGKGGHTVGRGQKGQGSRRNIGLLFEGVKVKKSMIKRLPLLRGRGKFSAGKKPLIIKLEQLNNFPVGTKITLEALIKAGLVDKALAETLGVKILAGGKLEKKLEIALPTSKSAAEEIEKLGGKVVGS